MKYIILWLLCLCLTFSPFSGFDLGLINLINNINGEKEPEPEPEPALIVEPIVEQIEEPQGRKITLNNTLDLDGYCTIRIPSEYWTILDENSTFTKKVIRYKDKKSRILMSYLTHISEDADIPGYITREAAGLDIVTNSKHEVEYESGTWMVIPHDELVDSCYPTIYYITSKDETTAFWMRVNRHPDTDEEEFNEVLEAIINSYSMYYIGGSIFETPTGGFYAENNVDGDGVISDTTNYKVNTQENTVWDSEKQGFDFEADIASKWQLMEIIIDDHKVTLPCSLQDLYDADFKPNDSNVKTDTYYIDSGGHKDIEFSNSKGTNITMTFINDSKTELKDISECHAVKIDIDTSSFVSVINKEEIESSSEEEMTQIEDSETQEERSDSIEETDEESETSEDEESETVEESEDDIEPISVMQGEKEFDTISHSVILPKGIMLNVYTQDIIDSYGEPNDKYKSESHLIYTWKSEGMYFRLECGVVKNIRHITLSTMESL